MTAEAPEFRSEDRLVPDCTLVVWIRPSSKQGSVVKGRLVDVSERGLGLDLRGHIVWAEPQTSAEILFTANVHNAAAVRMRGEVRHRRRRAGRTRLGLRLDVQSDDLNKLRQSLMRSTRRPPFDG